MLDQRIPGRLPEGLERCPLASDVARGAKTGKSRHSELRIGGMARGRSFVIEASYVPGRPASQHAMGSDRGTKVRKTGVVGEIQKGKEMSSSEWSVIRCMTEDTGRVASRGHGRYFVPGY